MAGRDTVSPGPEGPPVARPRLTGHQEHWAWLMVSANGPAYPVLRFGHDDTNELIEKVGRNEGELTEEERLVIATALETYNAILVGDQDADDLIDALDAAREAEDVNEAATGVTL